MTKKKVLLVDDSDEVLHLLKAILKGFKFEISTARNGVEAFDLVTSENFDLVITDTNMNGGDGVELLKHIRLVNRDLPVIVLFDFYWDDMKLNGDDVMKLGAAAILSKGELVQFLPGLVKTFLKK